MEVLEGLFEKALKLESPWRITRIEFTEKEGRIKVFIDFPRGSVFRCPKCKKELKAYDTTEKTWRHLNFFQYECYLVVRVPRTDCKEDGVLQIELPWARRDADFTFLFESFAMILCREMPVNKVSQIIKADDNKLWRMMNYYTEAARQFEDYSGVKRVGIDETSKTKGHDYVTLFVDLQESKTIFVVEGKGSETIEEFKKDLTEHGGKSENITDASIDMSPAFIKGVEENFLNAEITFDKFHMQLCHLKGGTSASMEWVNEQRQPAEISRLEMIRAGREPVVGAVEVDDCFIGGEEEGVSGRATFKKAKVVVAIEIPCTLREKIGRVRLAHIIDFSASSLVTFVIKNVAWIVP
jgi:transposase